jgi:putative membrane protein
MHWMNWMGGGWLMMMLWWAVIIAIIYFVVRTFTPAWNNRQNKEDSAVEILKKRYVRGEISKDEFEQKKKDIL